MTKNDYVRIDKVVISGPNIQVPISKLPCIKLVRNIKQNLPVGNSKFMMRYQLNRLFSGGSYVVQMFTDQANKITQNLSNASS